ncbi:MAG: TIGR03790 family protein [Limisphaerales bacterium]
MKPSQRGRTAAGPQFVLVAALLAGFAAAAAAAEMPVPDVVVVFNSRMRDSRGVAEHYAKRRGVPDRHVIGLELPAAETMSRGDYRKHLEGPLRDALRERGLMTWGAATNAGGAAKTVVTSAAVRHLALCYGVPARISEDPGTPHDNTEALADIVRRNEAAVDSELMLLPLSVQGFPLTGPLGNPLLGITNAAFIHPTSGVLAVARLDGPDAATARGLVDLALQAETNGLWGRAYFDSRGLTGGPYLPGDQWITNAAQIVAGFGPDTVLDRLPETFPPSFPMSHIALYAGWYDAEVSGPFTAMKVEFMPGAIAYHLHSFSAETLRTRTRRWAGPLLARGAAATMGCTSEPVLDGTPQIDVFFGRLMWLRFTFGEAALASQRALSWQITVVGDPLYRPFALNPLERLALHQAGQVATDLPWNYATLLGFRARADGHPANAIAGARSLSELNGSSVLQEKLGDLLREAGEAEEAGEWYVRALQHGPSVRQRWRLLRLAGDALEAAGDDAAAFLHLRNSANEVPDASDILDLKRRLAAMARRLNRPADAERWEREANGEAK